MPRNISYTSYLPDTVVATMKFQARYSHTGDSLHWTIQDSVGTTVSNSVQLVVSKNTPIIVTDLTPITTKDFDSVTVSVKAKSDTMAGGTPNMFLYDNGTLVSGSVSFTSYPPDTTLASMRLQARYIHNGDSLQWKVWNSSDTAKSTKVKWTITKNTPIIVTDLTPITSSDFDSVTVTVKEKSDPLAGGNPSILLYDNNVIASGSVSYTLYPPDTILASTKIQARYANNGDSLQWIVINSSDTAKSTKVKWTVNKVTPTITVQPVPISCNDVSAISDSVTATSTLSLSYQWYFNSVLVSGATSRIYTRTVAYTDSGLSVYCKVKNASDSINSSTAKLTVHSVIPSVSGPSDVSTKKSATFTVTETGTVPITNQWQDSTSGHTWTNIGGATGTTYTITTVDSTYNGRKYRDNATNVKGTTTSREALLKYVKRSVGWFFWNW